MTVDVVNSQNEKVGSLDLREEVFGGRVKVDLIHESVVRANAADRRGTHATKTRAMVSGTGKKPWRQKGTGRARVGEARNPLWRKGGIVFGPQPRSYDYQLPRRVERAGVRAALAQRVNDNALIVIERFPSDVAKTKDVNGMLKRLGAEGKTLMIDVRTDETFARAARNLAGAHLVPTGAVTARDVMDARRVIVTREAMERLKETLK